MKQTSFAMTDYFDKGKKTRRELFLAEMDQVVPWARLCALIEPYYPKASAAGGRLAPLLERMLRSYWLQQWYFSMKVHIGTDAGFGLVHTVEGSSANVRDTQVLGELLHGEEEALYGDSAYRSQETQALAEQSGLQFKVGERGKKKQPLTDQQKARNRRFSKVRAIGEHP